MRMTSAAMVAAAQLLLAAPALAQQNYGQIFDHDNIETHIRPIVHLRYSENPGQIAVGIFDSGDPMDTLSRETAALLDLNVITPLTPKVNTPEAERNQGTTAAQTITSGGWMGAILDPPEQLSIQRSDQQVRNGDPAHIFGNADTGNTHSSSSPDIHPYYMDYNADWSECHTGMPFVARDAPAQNRTAFVDPINGTVIPFAYCESDAGNGRGLGAASLPLDQRASSVSYLAPGSSRIPQPGRNDNPGFVHFVDLEAREFLSSTLTPNSAIVTVDVNQVADRYLRLVVSNQAAPAVKRLVPAQFGGLGPGYKPAGDNGDVIEPVSWEYRVNQPDIAIGGQQNPNGFERRNGGVYIDVLRQDGTIVLRGYDVIQLPSQAPRPYGRIEIPELGIDTGANPILIDTGCPDTGADIIGTDLLNHFGQFWDFRPTGSADGRLTLIGPTTQEGRMTIDEGMLINVGELTGGLERTAVEQERLHGAIPQLQNGANTYEAQNNPGPGEARGTIFRTHGTGSNAAYIDEDALAIARADKTVDAQSTGRDSINLHLETRLYFSVDGQAQGMAGTDVRRQYDLHQVAADVFATAFGQPNPNRDADPRNTLMINQEVMGLAPNYGPSADAPASADNLNGFDLFTQSAMPENSFSNLDSPIRMINDDGEASRPRVGDDRYGTNFDLYFSLNHGATIFRNATYSPWAEPNQIGLDANDDIDAIAISRPSLGRGVGGGDLIPGLDQVNPMGFDPNPSGLFSGIDFFWGLNESDIMLFSLAPGSPALALYGLSPGDVFITDFDGTFTMFGSCESLGLGFDDNIDGLDAVTGTTFQQLIPEPATLVLIAAAAPLLLKSRRRRRRNSRSFEIAAGIWHLPGPSSETEPLGRPQD